MPDARSPRQPRPTSRAAVRGWSLIATAALLAGCVATSDNAEPTGSWPRTVPSDYSGSFTTWHRAEHKKEEGFYLDGQRHGHVRSYRPDGTLEFEGRYVEGSPLGDVTIHQPDGTRVLEAQEEGRLHGPRRTFDADGQLRRVERFSRGLRHGEEESWHPDGTPATIGQWEQDQQAGRWQHWDEAGRLVREETFFLRDGLRVGYLGTAFEADGSQTQTRAMLGEDGWNSTHTTWHANGHQESYEEYREEARHGRFQQWDASGHLRLEGRYEHDARVGTWRSFAADGSVAEEWTENG